jgi:hypothetical protein
MSGSRWSSVGVVVAIGALFTGSCSSGGGGAGAGAGSKDSGDRRQLDLPVADD